MPKRPSTRPVAIGDQLDLDVESLADGPDALAKVDGYVLFVPGALPGERVRARVVASGRKFGRAELGAVLRPSAQRRAALCAHFGDCGGCHLQHLDYTAQLAHKTARVRRALAFALDLDADGLPVRDAISPGGEWQQRTKVALHFDGPRGRLRAGFYRLRSHDLVAIDDCPASEPRALAIARHAAEVLAGLRHEAFDPDRGTGLLRSVVVRVARSTGEAALLIVAAHGRVPGLEPHLDALRDAGATTIALNANAGPRSLLLGQETRVVAGPPRIADQIAEVRYLTSPAAFFQTSAAGASWLVDTVLRLGRPAPGERVADLYCGAGLLTLALARRARTVIGIEENPHAIGDAVASARLNRIGNARFLRGKVEHRLAELGSRSEGPLALAVLDPPRAGCAPAVLAALAAAAPPRIVYVSCNPDTLARDLAVLTGHGYELRTVEPADMFPHTHHVEAVAMLEWGGAVVAGG